MVIIIFATTFIAATYFAVLPTPTEVSSMSLRQLALTTLEALDEYKVLSETVFKSSMEDDWDDLEIALAASLPPNIAYNLTVYDIVAVGQRTTYRKAHSIANAIFGLGSDSKAASYLATSTNVTYMIMPQKVAGTLYILNCSDANGWWITGYTGQTLATDLHKLLSPYFNTTIVVQNTTDLGNLLNGTKISSQPFEHVNDAVILNTFGEAVPIPQGFYATQGYDSSHNSYAKYCYILGEKTCQYNWTWVSIVGWPLYYVTNTQLFSGNQNGWGIYGMVDVNRPGLEAFLQGLGNKTYSYQNSQTGNPGVVYFAPWTQYHTNYYGIYPPPYQTSTRALHSSILTTYDLRIDGKYGYVFQQTGEWIPGATYCHIGGDNQVHGVFTAIGLTRTPDIRVTALALLMHYHPYIYRTELTLSPDERPTQRLVILQLSQQGGG